MKGKTNQSFQTYVRNKMVDIRTVFVLCNSCTTDYSNKFNDTVYAERTVSDPPIEDSIFVAWMKHQRPVQFISDQIVSKCSIKV